MSRSELTVDAVEVKEGNNSPRSSDLRMVRPRLSAGYIIINHMPLRLINTYPPLRPIYQPFAE